MLAGNDITYNVTVHNAGPSQTVNGQVDFDSLPAGVDEVSAETGSFDPSSNIWTLGTIGSGESKTLVISVPVASDKPAGEEITLSATVSAGPDQNDSDLSNNTDQTITTVDTQATLNVTKVATNGANPITDIIAGETFDYEIEVTNDGPSDAQNVTVTDTLPTDVDFISALPVEASFDDATNTLSWIFPTIPAGTTESVSVTVEVDPDTSVDQITNTASATSDTPPGTPSDADNTIDVSSEADLIISKIAQVDGEEVTAVAVGDSFQYEIVVINDGPSTANNVVVTDNLDSGKLILNGVAGCSNSIDTTDFSVTCELDDIAPNSTKAIIIDVTIQGFPDLIGETIDNIAIANADNVNGARTTTPTTQVNIGGQSLIDLEVTKSASLDLAIADTDLTYTIGVKNLGPSVATVVELVDTLPDGVTLVSASLPDGCDELGGVITCDVGSLSNGEQADFIFDVTIVVDAPGVLSNSVSVSGFEVDPFSDNDLVTLHTPVAFPDVTDEGAQVEGESLTLSTGNIGPVDAEIEVPIDSVEPGTEIGLSAIPTDDPALPILPDGLSRVFALSPAGQTFSEPVELVVTYTDADVIGLDESTLTLTLLVGSGFETIADCNGEVVPHCVESRDTDENKITAFLNEFSTIGVQAGKIKIVTIAGEDEAMPGDDYFVVVSSSQPTASPTFNGSSLVPIANVSDLLIKTHGLDKIGTDKATHVLFETVPDGAPPGLLPIEVNFGEGAVPGSVIANLNVVAERTNRNFYLFPGDNYTGLALVPNDSSFASIANQPVPNANTDFGAVLGRTVVLEDVIESLFVFNPDSTNPWDQLHTRHPCGVADATCDDPAGGLLPASDAITLKEYQGMILRTRDSVNGDSVELFDNVNGDPVPVRFNVEGAFEPDPSSPPTKTVRVGYNLIAPHIEDDLPFDEAFANLVTPTQVASSATTIRAEIEVGESGGFINAVYTPFTETNTLVDSAGVEPEFAYWVFVDKIIGNGSVPVTPTLTPPPDDIDE